MAPGGAAHRPGAARRGVPADADSGAPGDFLSLSLSLYLSLSIYIYISLSISLSLYIYIYICTHVCVYV